MAWAQVTITLADERWVDPASAESNEHLLREHLLRDEAAPARFIALKSDAFTPEDGLAAVMQSLAPMPRPFDAVVLGMGDDGHTASLFPGMPGLADALNPGNPAVLVAARAPVSPESRISMTMATLLDARKIFVPIAGPAKRAVYDEAKAGSPSSSRYPAAVLFKQSRVPVVVLITGNP
jgi:6-phosphogluconolactonase